MHPSESVIYAATVAGKPIRYQTRSTTIPVVGGACTLSEAQRKQLAAKGYKFDDENSPLSNLNPQWADLTSILWVLLNARNDNIGTAQYRRTWEEPDQGWYDPEVLYVPEPIKFKYSLKEQVGLSHRTFNAVAITKSTAMSGKWILTKDEICGTWAQNTFYGCLMARGPRDAYRWFMTTLFDGLWPIWDRYHDHFMSLTGYDIRAIAFIAERVMTAMVLNKDRLFPGIRIETAPIRFIPDDPPKRTESPGAAKHRALREKRKALAAHR
jgi:hypothetical protein